MGPPPALGPPSPHESTPRITEVLADVPPGVDPSRDGRRDAIGDEFVELVNPGPFPIDLTGWELRGGGASFRFPAFSLPGGSYVVCFNGWHQSWVGPVGDDEIGPAGPNPRFGDAWVFTMRRGRRGFANDGGEVTLHDAGGGLVDRLAWDGTVHDRSLVPGPTGEAIAHPPGPGRVGCSPGERTPDGMADQAQRDDRDRTP
ncbi:MAG: lamin tail domain-containing protein [Phycisphaerales bacterium]|nr:lamin tail domain-containing protein [Phycisphaerales bacterium]